MLENEGKVLKIMFKYNVSNKFYSVKFLKKIKLS